MSRFIRGIGAFRATLFSAWTQFRVMIGLPSLTPRLGAPELAFDVPVLPAAPAAPLELGAPELVFDVAGPSYREPELAARPQYFDIPATAAEPPVLVTPALVFDIAA